MTYQQLSEQNITSWYFRKHNFSKKCFFLPQRPPGHYYQIKLIPTFVYSIKIWGRTERNFNREMWNQRRMILFYYYCFSDLLYCLSLNMLKGWQGGAFGKRTEWIAPKGRSGWDTELRFKEHLNVDTISFSVIEERAKFFGKKSMGFFSDSSVNTEVGGEVMY